MRESPPKSMPQRRAFGTRHEAGGGVIDEQMKKGIVGG
jgi:hypothetical protein